MFAKALPIWLDGKEKEMNIQARFVASFLGVDDCVLKITGSTFYRVFLNGKLIHYGPAPVAHGCARVDEVCLEDCLGKNELVVEAAGYNCFSYACVKQPSFIQAEIICGGKCVCATGFDFEGCLVAAREQKVIRYSFQRHFTEIWDLDKKDVPHKISVLDMGLKYLRRNAPLPDMSEEHIHSIYSTGRFTESARNWQLPSLQGATDNICDKINGFKLDEIKEIPIMDFANLDYAFSSNSSSFPCALGRGEYAVFECRSNTCGMMKLEYTASDNGKFLIAFDEKIIDGRFDFKHWNNMNVISVKSSGKNCFYNFEVYGYKYFAVFVLNGKIDLNSVSVVKVINPILELPKLNTNDETIQKIYKAAFESAKCNSLGIFMDCPTRERAGWLCDSYFSAKADWVMTGNTNLEDDFVENYLHANCQQLPKGMLPMCYPADHPDGNYIPQWSMWFIAQLDEYLIRNPAISACQFHELTDNLLAYFLKYENELGLLENLDGWNFVEWTRASDWTDGVHFPTNMLYSFILKIIGKWYDDDSLKNKSELIKKKIIELSYDGQFFKDNAVRNEANELVCQNNISEICQYYAFMFDVASQDCFDELKNTLAEKFAPESSYRPDIERVNVFTGMYMRMELLRRWKLYDRLINEIKVFFAHMSDITGTLWETKDMTNSLNHGFTAYLIVILLEIYNDNHQ
ncbi:MAG: hypothetical protein IKV73_07505 [Clostridia bacterium]|nr:hypothetical protein [Clostridia bacterium]